MRKFNRQQENNSMFQHAADQIILKQKGKFIAEDETQQNIASEIDKYDINEIDNMSLDENKKNKE